MDYKFERPWSYTGAYTDEMIFGVARGILRWLSRDENDSVRDCVFVDIDRNYELRDSIFDEMGADAWLTSARIPNRSTVSDGEFLMNLWSAGWDEAMIEIGVPTPWSSDNDE